MNILGIDTSTKKANVCIEANDKLIDKSIDNEITHSEKLLPLVDGALKEAGITLKEIEYLACSIGPGSFTGIRIGIATIKAFAKVIEKPVFAPSSLDVIAYTDTKDTASYVISIMDAKNSRIYYSVYKQKYLKHYSKSLKILETILVPSNDTIDVALEKINDVLIKGNSTSTTSLKVIGDCAFMYEDLFINKLDYLFNDIITYNENISGKALINMAENYIKLGYDEKYKKDYLTLDALYVRPSQAERAKQNEL